MSLVLYSSELSVPCRVVRMVAVHINLDITVKDVSGPDGLRVREELLNITGVDRAVPVLVDRDFTLCESHAIITYLVDKYASDSPLYPADTQTRAKIRGFLMFDVGTLSRRMTNYFYPVLFHNAEEFDTYAEALMQDALKVLGYFLCHNKYLVGDGVTLADIAVAGALSITDAADYSLSPYPKVEFYYRSLKKELPYFAELNDKPIEMVRKTVRKE